MLVTKQITFWFVLKACLLFNWHSLFKNMAIFYVFLVYIRPITV